MHRLEKTILHALEEISDVSRFPFPLEASIGSVIADDAVFQFDVDLPGAGAEGRVGYVSGHVYALKN